MSERKEDWRLSFDKKRPIKNIFGEEMEKKAELPECLYRQIDATELFLLWRDFQLPLQIFQGSSHSKVEADSVGNFWFAKPMVFNRQSFEVLVKTEPKKWKNNPAFVQKSEMFYKDKDYNDPFCRPRLLSVEEFHTGNILSLDELQISVSNVLHNRIVDLRKDLIDFFEEKNQNGDKIKFF